MLTLRQNLALLCLLATALFWIGTVRATEHSADHYNPRPFLEQAVAGAEKIARIKITKRRPLLYPDSEPRKRCGYAYTANVVESLRGGNESFEFFLTDDADFISAKTDYLIFAYATKDVTPSNARVYLDTFAEREEEAILCRASTKYYLPSFISTLWPFSSDGLWVGPSQRPDVIWCSSGKYGFEAPQRTDLFNFRDSSASGQLVVGWDSAKRLILRALSNSPYQSGVVPRFGAPIRSDFRPGKCS